MEISKISPDILAKINPNVITAAKIRGAGIRFAVNTCICVLQCENSGLKGCKTFETYDEALASVKKWQSNVMKKYNCGEFSHERGYTEGFGWTNLVAYTRKKKGLPIFATVHITCGVDK